MFQIDKILCLLWILVLHDTSLTGNFFVCFWLLDSVLQTKYSQEGTYLSLKRRHRSIVPFQVRSHPDFCLPVTFIRFFFYSLMLYLVPYYLKGLNVFLLTSVSQVAVKSESMSTDFLVFWNYLSLNKHLG